MHAIGGGGLGVLVLLQGWAQDHGIRFKLFNPCGPVRNKLKHINCEIATLEQMMTLLSRVDSEYARVLIESQFPSHRLSQYSWDDEALQKTPLAEGDVQGGLHQWTT
jgi:hypothetical protein